MSLLKSILLAAILLLFVLPAGAQQYTVKGKVVDTFNYKTIAKASVSLVRASDSVLSTFTRTANDGSFVLKPDTAGVYFLIVAYPQFLDYIDKITVSKPLTDVGEVSVFSRSTLLNEFVLKQNTGSIKIKGDTVEYMADSFAVRENATVEELLKKLPGLTVDKNGKVTAQGEKVQKILVDGEEFFSDDPAVVTKSLAAKTVESVQVYDKKSDQALFTGIDDGQKEKTINLKLKENMKKGAFGKVSLGGGTDGFYENQVMLNAFKGKRQFSVFGILSNTANVGLSWEDARKYGTGGSGNVQFSDDGVITTFSGDESYSGNGLPQVGTGGIHYANKWNDGKEHVSANYRGMNQNIESINNTITQYILPDSQYFSKNDQTSYDRVQRHKVDGLFEWTIDTTSNLRFTADAGYTEVRNFDNFNTRTYSGDVDINRSNRTTQGDANKQGHSMALTYRKKLKKKARTITADLNENFGATQGISKLFAANSFYINGQLVDIDTTNQQKNVNSNSLSISGNATYTEPLSDRFFLELRYGLNLQNNQSKLFSYNAQNGGENYTDFDSTFSSNYNYDYITHTGGTSFRYVSKKVKANIGASISQTGFDQQDLLRNTELHRDFTNFFPSANFNYEIKKMENLRLNYSGSTRQPSISQIQPLRQNTDPLNITVGNPNLKQEFNHTIGLGYNSYKVFTETYKYAGGGFSFVNDDITQSTVVDGQGRSVAQYINVDGNSNGYFYGGIGSKIKKLDLQVGLNTNVNFNRNNNFVNGLKNTSTNNTYSIGLRMDYDVKDKIDVSLNPGVTYNQNNASISSKATSFWSYNQEFNITVQLPYKFEVNTAVNWQWRQRTGQFDNNNNVVLWDAYITRKFLKGDQLELRAMMHDILNQNIGFSRFGNSNVVTQKSYNTIRRYGMLSLIWNFTYTPKGAVKTGPDAADILDGLQLN